MLEATRPFITVFLASQMVLVLRDQHVLQIKPQNTSVDLVVMFNDNHVVKV